jgi:hypothetical protein
MTLSLWLQGFRFGLSDCGRELRDVSTLGQGIIDICTLSMETGCAFFYSFNFPPAGVMEGVLFFMEDVKQFLPLFHLLSKSAEMLLLQLCFYCVEKCDWWFICNLKRVKENIDNSLGTL